MPLLIFKYSSWVMLYQKTCFDQQGEATFSYGLNNYILWCFSTIFLFTLYVTLKYHLKKAVQYFFHHCWSRCRTIVQSSTEPLSKNTFIPVVTKPFHYPQHSHVTDSGRPWSTNQLKKHTVAVTANINHLF